MTRRLEVVDARDPRAVLHALRDALSGEGPAILPRDPGAVEAQASAPLPAEVAQNVALVVETSGSTGAPKRVAISADALLASAAATAAALGAPGQWLLALPAHYIAGIQVLVRSLAAGIDPVILAPGRFDPAAFAASAAGMMPDVPHYVSLVPVQLARLLDAAADDPALLAVLQGLDGILVGGQALGEELRRRALEHGLRVVRTYGSTETCGGCVYDGRPLGQVRARTVGGELELAGPMLAKGYLGEPGRTERVFHVDGGVRWYRTGDLGAVEGGVVRVTGRADSVIVSGGVKVSLDAVERAVRGLPGFGEAVVVGCEDDEWGEVPVVVIPGVERMPGASPGVPDRARDGSLEGAQHESPDRARREARGRAQGEARGRARREARGGARDEARGRARDEARDRVRDEPLVRNDPGALGRLRDHVGSALGPAARPARIVVVTALPLLPSGKPDRVAIARAAAEGIRP